MNMKHLSTEHFQNAVTFLKANGRPIEQALVAHFFEDAPLETVLTALAGYQNADGGFGHALEPDLRISDSSVIATTIALQHLRDLRVPTDHPLWHGAMRYLAATYDPDRRLWWSVPATIDSAPHAPWWTFEQPGGGSVTLNPRAEIVGFLYDVYDLPEFLPASLREELLEEVLVEIESRPNDLERHELQSALRLVETERLPSESRTRLMVALHTALSGMVGRHPDEWVGYTLTPLSVVSGPSSPFYSKYADVIPANFEFILREQHDDGSWVAPWSWEDPRIEWPTVAKDLNSWVTWINLNMLRRFDAIDMKTAS
jgi:hypothetical protein